MKIARGVIYRNASGRMEKLVTNVVGNRVFYIRFYNGEGGRRTLDGGNSSVKHFVNWAYNPERKHKPFVRLSERRVDRMSV